MVVYNFDDIIERLLSSDEVKQFYNIEKEIYLNVYSYGRVTEKIINKAHYHFGTFPLNFGETPDPQSISLSLYHVHGIVTNGITPIPLVFSVTCTSVIFQAIAKSSLSSQF